MRTTRRPSWSAPLVLCGLAQALATALLPQDLEVAVTSCTRTPPLQPLTTAPLLNDGKCVVVVAAEDQTASDLELVRFLFPAACEVAIIDKAATPCAFMPLQGITSCIGLPNVGREQHSYLHYIRSNYNALPEYIFFIPSVLTKHSRVRAVQTMLNESASMQIAPAPIRLVDGRADTLISPSKPLRRHRPRLPPRPHWLRLPPRAQPFFTRSGPAGSVAVGLGASTRRIRATGTRNCQRPCRSALDAE